MSHARREVHSAQEDKEPVVRAMRVDRSLRYGVAVAAGVVAFSVTDVLQRIGHPGSFSLFTGAVLLAAWYGGAGPGVVTLVFSATSASLLPEIRAAHADPALHLAVFVPVALLAVAVGNMARRARTGPAPRLPGTRAAADGEGMLLAMISDELRAPIDPLVMQVEMLSRESRVPPFLREQFGEVRKRIDVELRLLDDLTDLSVLDRGKLSLASVYTNLHDTLQEAAQACEVELLEKQIELNLRFTASRPHVMADPEKLEQLFFNLIHGVTRIVPSGGAIDVVTSDGVDGQVVVNVSGIRVAVDPERVSSVVRSAHSTEDLLPFVCRFDGLSFGLSVCEALTSALGGRVSAGPIDQGRGVMLTVSFPTVEPKGSGNGHRPRESGATGAGGPFPAG